MITQFINASLMHTCITKTWYVKGIKNGCPCIVEIRGTQGCALVRDLAWAAGECREVAMQGTTLIAPDLHNTWATILNPFYNMEYKIIKKIWQNKMCIEVNIPCINLTPNLYTVLWISPSSWVPTGPPMVENWVAQVISWLPELFWLIFKRYLFFKLSTQNWHVFHLIIFPLTESWVAHRATSRVMLDRPTA